MQLLQNKRARFWVFSILFTIVIALRLGILYHQRALFYAYDWGAKWEIILLSILISIGGRIVAGLVWGDMMNRLGSNVTMLSHVQYYCLARLSRRIPGKIWFLASRGYLYKQDGDSFRLVAVASGIEFAITLLSGVLVTLLTVSYTILNFANPLYYIIGLTAIVGVTAFCLHPQTIARLLTRVGLTDIPNLSYLTLLKWLGSYMIIWVIGGLMLYLIANIVTEVPLGQVNHIIGGWCLISIFSLITIAVPTNLGINDIGLSLLLMPILSSSVAAVVAVLFYLLVLVYEFVGFAIIMVGIWVGERLKLKI